MYTSASRPAGITISRRRLSGERASRNRGLCANWRVRACVSLALVSLGAIASPAQTLTTEYRFGGSTSGSVPSALSQANDGLLWGTTASGGTYGHGTVFKQVPGGGTFTSLYSFCPETGCTDGEAPEGGAIEAVDGHLYGTTSGGGAYGQGTVFQIATFGTLTTIFSFNFTDGSTPQGALIQGSDGDLYGTTSGGGANASCGGGLGCGTVFKVTVSGVLTTLYNFCSEANCADGAEPEGGLIEDVNGNFYGTTRAGGSNSSCVSGSYTGCGTAFEITAKGVFKQLYSFCSKSACADGASPTSGLIQGRNGNFYGTTSAGGANACSGSGCGTAFSLTSSGKLTKLYSFCSKTSCADGEYPSAPLVLGSDGNLYGTTSAGGSKGDGTVFEITPSGVLTTPYSFCSVTNCSDGETPTAALMQDTGGEFYGTTSAGGTLTDCEPSGCGTLFELKTGLKAFVDAVPPFGPVGTAVRILGNQMTGATSVTFNGVSASFTVVSSAYIKTTVPVGATTGKIQVVTPKGTLSSSVPFTVTP